MCFPGRGTHITKDMCFPGTGTHITRDSCFPGGGTHITRDMRFYSLERRFFVLEYRKRNFPGLYCPKKKKLEKRPFLDQKKWVNPFRKKFSWKKENKKRNFPGLYCPKKKLEKWPFLDQNHGLTPLEKCQFFDFLNFLFL